MLLQQLCERLLQAHQDIRGIILFGSLAREEPHQDVDLMVVVGQKMEPSHYLSALLRSLLTGIQDVVWREGLERMAQMAAEMEPAAVGSRYPVEVEEKVIWPVERYGETEAARALDLARESLEIGRAFAHWWTEGNENA